MVSLQALNKLLQTGNAEFIDSNDFDASYFTDYEQEYNFIMSHYKKYKTMPDKETVLDKFPKFSIIEVNEYLCLIKLLRCIAKILLELLIIYSLI